MRSRRGRGEGSVFGRRDGVWAGSVTVGYDERGTRKRRTVYGANKCDVLEKLARLRADGLAGILGDPQRLAVTTFLHRWLEDVVRPSVRATVHRRYTEIVRLRLVPQIGGIALSRLTPVHVQSLLTSLEGKACRLVADRWPTIDCIAPSVRRSSGAWCPETSATL